MLALLIFIDGVKKKDFGDVEVVHVGIVVPYRRKIVLSHKIPRRWHEAAPSALERGHDALSS